MGWVLLLRKWRWGWKSWRQFLSPPVGGTLHIWFSSTSMFFTMGHLSSLWSCHRLGIFLSNWILRSDGRRMNLQVLVNLRRSQIWGIIDTGWKDNIFKWTLNLGRNTFEKFPFRSCLRIVCSWRWFRVQGTYVRTLWEIMNPTHKKAFMVQSESRVSLCGWWYWDRMRVLGWLKKCLWRKIKRLENRS